MVTLKGFANYRTLSGLLTFAIHQYPDHRSRGEKSFNEPQEMNYMKSKLFLALILVSLGLVSIFNSSVNKTSASAAATQEKLLKAEHAIPGNYIVVLNEQAGNPHEEALSLASTYGGSARHVYARALKGFSGTLSEAAAIALSHD